MISIILGTRPEIIKMTPVIRACLKTGTEFSVLHTGQHYSYDMDRIFFEELDLPAPEFCLDIGSGTHAEQTGKSMIGIEKILMANRPEIVLVQGDTNTVLAGSLAASKLNIPLGHVEAGLRSYDRRMPEEVNRVVADHLSDFLFTPTAISRNYLLNEGIDEKKILVTGNTIVDAVSQNREISNTRTKILDNLGITPNNYFLVTAHRAENVDIAERLGEIMCALSRLQKQYSLPVIFPVHPRTRKMLSDFRIPTDGINILSPVGYLDFLELEAHASLVLTDSGGVQEECCILHVPCVTMRLNTERPETIDIGANLLAGTDVDAIVRAVDKMIIIDRKWKNPYGDGKAGERIVEFCKKTCTNKTN